MAIRDKQQRLDALRQEIVEIEAELKDARALLGMTTNRRRGGSTVQARRRPIRENSTVWWAQKVLDQLGHQLHTDVLVQHIEELSGLSVRKSTLVSNLSRYVRTHDTFTRPASSTYGLIEFNASEEAVQENTPLGASERG